MAACAFAVRRGTHPRMNAKEVIKMGRRRSWRIQSCCTSSFLSKVPELRTQQSGSRSWQVSPIKHMSPIGRNTLLSELAQPENKKKKKKLPHRRQDSRKLTKEAEGQQTSFVQGRQTKRQTGRTLRQCAVRPRFLRWTTCRSTHNQSGGQTCS